jgi:flagellar hook-associated protein 2
MSAITSVGLISGIDTASIVNELISLDAQPISLLQTQISSAQAQTKAYNTIEASLNSIHTIAQSLALPQTFQAATTNSSNPNVLTATAATGAAVGSYQLQVAQLVTTQQSISGGFSDPNNSPVGAGTITLEQGGGEASSETPLAQLNGGAGVQSGQFRITDRSGSSAVINTSSDITLDDVVNQINNTQGINVKASIVNNALALTDETGKTTASLAVADLSGGTTAASLGIAGTAGGNTLNGSNINYISAATPLSQLNDGNGVSTTTAGQTDFSVKVGDGSTINVALGGLTTVGAVISAINKAGGSKLKASINSSGNGLALTDTSGGGGGLSVTSASGSSAAKDLGLTGGASGNTIQGTPVIGALDSVLIRSLNGGNGIPLGTISITDRNGTAGNINLSGAVSVSDIINDINNNSSGVKVTAALDSAGTGIQLTDASGGSGNLVIGDVNSTTAAALGIKGTFDTSTPTVSGANLQRQYVSNNTQLSDFNGGNGVSLGQFQITSSKGGSATVDLSQGSFNTIGDVINAINAKKLGVTASINTNGNGILLTDTAGGTGKLKVTDLGGTTAADLNIAGTATRNTIDGALQKTITVTSTDTLSSLQTKINTLGFGVTANIVNDGSAGSPYHLSLTAVNSGAAGRVVIDSGTTNLGIRNLVNAQNAAVFYGGTGNTQPLLITSNKNQFTNVIKGVTVNLLSASSSPVTLSVTPDSSAVESQLQNFVTDYNTVVGTITQDSTYDTTNNVGGLLLGDGTTQQVQEVLNNLLNSVVKGVGSYNDLSSIGITVNADGIGTTGTTLNFNSSTFESAFASNPTGVQNLFSTATTGLGNVISTAINGLTDPVNGIITLEDQTLSTRITQFQGQITNLNAILADKRTQLENEFANMETTLASLESQSSIISGIATSAAATKAASSSTTSSTSSGSTSSSSTSSA